MLIGLSNFFNLVYSGLNLHENSSRGSRVLCGRTDRQTDLTKLLVACRNFANAPKNASIVTKTVRKAVIRPSNTEREVRTRVTDFTP
jgi:hypothetical protein